MKELVRLGSRQWNVLTPDQKATYQNLSEYERLKLEQER